MTRPISREYTTVWESAIYTLLHRIFSGVYSLTNAVLFESGAIVAQTVIGLISDLRHSNYKYFRHAGAAVIAAISAIGYGAWGLVRAVLLTILGKR